MKIATHRIRAIIRGLWFKVSLTLLKLSYICLLEADHILGNHKSNQVQRKNTFVDMSEVESARLFVSPDFICMRGKKYKTKLTTVTLFPKSY